MWLHSQKAINYTKGIESYSYGMYLIYYYQSRYPEALEYLLQCIKQAEELNDDRELAICYSGVGSMFYMQKKYPEVIKNFQLAKENFEKTGDYPDAVRTMVNMGNVYLGMNEYDRAIGFFRMH